ncbi:MULTISPECIES: tetratricopeptide repeat protein [Bacteroidales]|uniref:tetratricopeptide repeat protein n=1 Tax=Bacteroidales TaxID=171549 RepID=UPI0005C49EEE|nr:MULTISPECIES: tetratricopeptide repeat protein [Bacteroidales]
MLKEETDYLSANDRRKFDYFYLEGTRLAQKGEIDAAFDMLRQAAAVDTMSASVKYALASYYLQLNKPQIAYDMIKDAARIDKDNYWYGMMLANLAQNLGDNEQAEKAYQALIANNPQKPELNYMLAETYAQKGEYQKAIDSYEKMEQSMGIMEPITLQKVKLYKALKNDEKAYAEVEKLIKAYPQEIGYLILLGDIYLNDNKDDKALEMYDRAEKMEPDNGYLLVSKANYYNRKGDKEKYLDEIRKALSNKKIDVETKVKILTDYLSDLLQKKENLGQAYQLFSELVDMHPQEESIYSLYAEFLLSQKKYKEAGEQLQVAVDLAPNNKQYWLQLMGVNMQLGELDEVITVGEKALTYIPDAAEIYMYMGSGYAMQKDYDKAIDILKRGISHLDENNNALVSDYYGQLGDSYYLSGDKDKAFEAFENALLHNPKNTGVLNNYSYFLALDKRDLSKAERMSGDVIKIEPDNPTFLDTYAWVFFQQGNYTLAKIYLQNALNKGGDKSADLLEHYGDVLFMLGEVDEALQYWEKAKDAGSESEVLPRKIKDKKYYEK